MVPRLQPNQQAPTTPNSVSPSHPQTMLPQPIPITDPATLAAMRRLVRAQIAALLALYALALIIHLALPYRIWHVVVMVAVMVTVLIHLASARRRILGTFRLGQAIFPQPLGITDTVVFSLIPWAPISLAFVSPMRPQSWLFAFIAMPATIVGMYLAIHAMMIREPRPPCCPKCAYPVGTLAFPLMCPECARPMPTPEAATTIPRVPHRGLACIGATLCVLGLTLAATTLFRPAAVYNAFPRPALLRAAPSDRRAFEALNLASLSPAEAELLTDRILDARAKEPDAILRPQLNWLGQRLISGAMTPEQTNRFAREGWTLSITTNQPPRVGQPVLVSLMGDCPDHDPAVTRFVYFIQSIDLNGVPTLDHPRNWFHSDYLDWDWRIRLRDGSRVDAQPTATITPETTAPIHARARIVAAVIVTGITPTITWHDDGTYTITPAPLTTHELTAETTLQVTP